MKKLRKTLALIMSVIMVLSLAACGGDDTETTDVTTKYEASVDETTTVVENVSEEETTEETTAGVEEDTTGNEESSKEEETTVSEETSKEEETTKEVGTTEKQTTVDKETTAEKQTTTQKQTTEKQTTTQKQTTEKQTTTQKPTTEKQTTKAPEQETTTKSYAEEQKELENADLLVLSKLNLAVQVAYDAKGAEQDALDILDLYNGITLEKLLTYKENIFVKELIKELEGLDPYEALESDSAWSNVYTDIYVGAKGGSIGVWLGTREAVNRPKYLDAGSYEAGQVNLWDLGLRNGSRYVELEVWTPAEMQYDGWLEDIQEKFRLLHPELTISFVNYTCSTSDAYKYIAPDPAKGADVYLYASDTTEALVKAGALLPFGSTSMKYIKEVNSNIFRESLTVDGKIYGVAYSANTWFMYYDKSVFKGVDITSLDAMLEVGKVSFPLKNGWYNQAFFLATGCSFSESVFDFGGAKAEEALQYMVDKFNSGRLVYCDGIDLLQDGQVNAAMSGSWSAAGAKKYLGDNYGVAAIPKINTTYGDGQLKAMSGSFAVGVNPYSTVKEVAIEFAKFMCSEEVQESMYENVGVVPCNTKVVNSNKYKNDELMQALNKTMNECSIIMPKYLTGDNWWTPASNLGYDIVDGTFTDVKARVEEFNQTINNALR